MSYNVREQVVVSVGPDGSITAETIGIKGNRCLDYIQVLENLLDATTTSSVFTDEYHQTLSVQDQEEPNDLRQR